MHENNSDGEFVGFRNKFFELTCRHTTTDDAPRMQPVRLKRRLLLLRCFTSHSLVLIDVPTFLTSTHYLNDSMYRKTVRSKTVFPFGSPFHCPCAFLPTVSLHPTLKRRRRRHERMQVARLDAERAAAEAAEAEKWMGQISLEGEGLGAEDEEAGKVPPCTLLLPLSPSDHQPETPVKLG